MVLGTRTVCAIAICAGIPVHSFATRGASPDSVVFPEGYRRWAHVKSVLVGPESPAFATEAGIHHIYANEEALEGYRTGRFPEGATIVYDLLETAVVKGNTIEGPQRRVDVMTKDASRYPATGGWGFGRFFGRQRGQSSLSAEQQAACFACHSTRNDHDSVFSRFRE